MAQQAASGNYPLPESPVTVYYDGDPRLNRALVKSLSDEVAEKTAHVISAVAEDYADYKERCGYIAGLRRAIEIAQETEKKLRD